MGRLFALNFQPVLIMFDKITVSELTTWLLSFVFLALCITPFGLLLFRFVLQWGFFVVCLFLNCTLFLLHPLNRGQSQYWPSYKSRREQKLNLYQKIIYLMTPVPFEAGDFTHLQSRQHEDNLKRAKKKKKWCVEKKCR